MRVRETAMLLDGSTRLSLQPQGAASCSVCRTLTLCYLGWWRDSSFHVLFRVSVYIELH